MEEGTVKTTTIESLAAGDALHGQQLISVQTPSDDQQLIMVTFDGNTGLPMSEDGNTVTGAVAVTMCDNETQTETVFGLEDLPIVKEIVRKTIAKTQRQEPDVSVCKQQQDMFNRPVNGIYTCPICARVYRNKLSWQNHLASHNGDEVHMCGVCGQLFNSRVTLSAHLEVHMKEERALKKQRDMMFGSADLKVSGVYMPGDIIPNEDKLLKKQSSIDNSIVNAGMINIDGTHTDTENYVAATEEVMDDSLDTGDLEGGNAGEADSEGSYVYACNVCGEQYSVKEDCEKHLLVHTGDGVDVPTTSHASTSYKEDPPIPSPPRPIPTPSSPIVPPSTQSSLESRLTISKPKFNTYIYACNVCGKQYTNKSNCKRHMMIHTDDRKVYECEYCLKRFSQKYEVRMHSRIHTGEKPYSCAVCGKTFTERGNWRRHTQIHVRPQEAAPYRCGICCKGFFHPEKLQVHLQIHSGQRPFVCTVCGRKVKKIGDMYRHLRTHTGEKPYKCQVCGKGFAQNGNLKDHMKVHTGEKPHICDICGKDFARKILLKEHVKNHHKGATLADLTEAALEEIERQEAAMETVETEDLQVVHDGTPGNIQKVIRYSGKTIVIGGPSVSSADEEQLLNEESELELHDVQTDSLTEKELEAAHMLTVVQDGTNMVYTLNTDTDQGTKNIVVTKVDQTDVQNS